MTPVTLQTEIEIEASPERVWQTLTDFAAYPQWNPFIVRIEGALAVGARLKAMMRPVGSRGMTFTPTVLQSIPNREFRWVGRLWLPGIMDGEHSFRIEPLETASEEPMASQRIRFVQSETFRGVLVPLFLRLMRAGTLAGFNAMNRALKQRVEQVAEQAG
jgi:hypothetical protein